MAEVKQRQDAHFMLIFVLAITSSFSPLSVDFFAPSMPNVARELEVAAQAVKNSLYVFFIGYGLSPFLWGLLADRFGRRVIMLSGILIYLFASLGCFYAEGIVEMSIFRFIQGLGAASGVIVARATLRDIHGAAGATRAISSMFLIMVWVPILGPLIGGYIASHFNWRFGFLVMVLVASLMLLGSFLWQHETVPDKPPEHLGVLANGKHILTNAVFLRHALANMFCVGTMLLFIANFSYIAEQQYGFTAQQNGRVLAIFNASLSAGVYLVRLVVPRVGIENTIYFGLWTALAGWLVLWGLCINQVFSPMQLLFPMIIACLGTGMMISLSAGQALVPFTYTAGVASALFVCVQSAGSSLISFITTFFIHNDPKLMATALLLCSLLAMLSMKFRSRRATR